MVSPNVDVVSEAIASTKCLIFARTSNGKELVQSIVHLISSLLFELDIWRGKEQRVLLLIVWRGGSGVTQGPGTHENRDECFLISLHRFCLHYAAGLFSDWAV
jgi:hypothetical protein